MAAKRAYRGRFAPSPTGPLHAGSLVAAVASYLDARHNDGVWLVRMEDLDPPREVEGAAPRILRSLEAHGLYWDDAVLYQSTRLEAYASVLDDLQKRDLVFPCCCTRATLGPGGSCGRRCDPGADDHCSVRMSLDTGIETTPNDVVLKRKDGLFAYALAVVVDDAWQRISHVVRGEDLLAQTSAQQQLHRIIGNRPPQFAHIPVLRDAQGNKLSKQAGASALDDRQPLRNLRAALAFLRQPAATADTASATQLLELAAEQWRRPISESEATVYPTPASP